MKWRILEWFCDLVKKCVNAGCISTSFSSTPSQNINLGFLGKNHGKTNRKGTDLKVDLAASILKIMGSWMVMDGQPEKFQTSFEEDETVLFFSQQR